MKKKSFLSAAKKYHHHTAKQLLPLALVGALLVFSITVGTSLAQQSQPMRPSGNSGMQGSSGQSFLGRLNSSFSSGLSKITSKLTKKSSTATTPSSNTTITSAAVDVTKLPVGDNKYVTTGPKMGYVYLCKTPTGKSGAGSEGPWIDQTAQTWNLNQKVTVDGSISWPNATWTISTSGTKRILTSNGLPNNHTTGTYPVATTDDAYTYDRNPNSIKIQSYTLSLPVTPTLLTTPECVGGEVGIMLSGVPIFNAFDAAGQDAPASEIQDSCAGHPQSSGSYHYHNYSDCLSDTSAAGEHSELVGYAFDGFGIYGLKGEGGTELGSADLDECHGHVGTITWEGKKVSMYHYHMTRDFPYSVSCFRGKKAVVKLTGEMGTTGSGMGTQGQQVQPGQGGMTGTRPSGSGRPMPSGQPPAGGMMPRRR